jgi:hypothetical protein
MNTEGNAEHHAVELIRFKKKKKDGLGFAG